MTRFRFALERVLRVRHIEQDLARIAWSDAEREARAAREVVAGVAARIEAEQVALCVEQRAGRWNAGAMLLRFECLDRLRRSLVDAARVVSERETVAERARIEWNARRSDERGIEKLEHRRRAAHDLEALHSENAFIDEQASMRAARQHSASAARPSDRATARTAPRSNAGSSSVNEA
jgi:flagellar export protein FliJ